MYLLNKIYIFFLVNEGSCDTHFIVLYKYRIYKINAYHPVSENLLNVSEIYQILNNLVQKYSSEGDGVGIGGLTADYRDDWAQVFEIKYFLNVT
jgi:hypothetical protein